MYGRRLIKGNQVETDNFNRVSPKSCSDQALFIKQVKDPHLGFDQVDDGLVVIEINQRPWDVLFHVLLLLQLEHVLKVREAAERSTDAELCFCDDFWLMVAYQVKLLLKLFIGIVDAKLFEAVDVKGFKAADKRVCVIKQKHSRVEQMKKKNVPRPLYP